MKVREAVTYAFERLSINSHGCELIVSSGSADAMIQSFIGHSKDDKHLQKDDGLYLIHLLEGFVNLTFSDMGIEPLLGKGAVSNFNLIISQPYVRSILPEEHALKIIELSLRVLGNISINHEGK